MRSLKGEKVKRGKINLRIAAALDYATGGETLAVLSRDGVATRASEFVKRTWSLAGNCFAWIEMPAT